MEGKESLERHFAVDTMLGKLAKWLRVLGFDTRYERFTGPEQLEKLLGEGFILVTRNQRWCNLRGVLCPKDNDPMKQLGELISMAVISPGDIRLFRRCVLCNEQLEPLSREDAFGSVPDYVFETNTIFHQCPSCHRVFWPGSHPKRMMELLHRLFGWSLRQ
jgi:uncharacterized protein with PIN domain